MCICVRELCCQKWKRHLIRTYAFLKRIKRWSAVSTGCNIIYQTNATTAMTMTTTRRLCSAIIKFYIINSAILYFLCSIIYNTRVCIIYLMSFALMPKNSVMWKEEAKNSVCIKLQSKGVVSVFKHRNANLFWNMPIFCSTS